LTTDKTPSYSQICRRTNKLDIDINYRIDDDDDDRIVITIDSIGIKVTNRGQLMQDKWHIGKRGYLKIHGAVDIKTNEILHWKLQMRRYMMKRLWCNWLNRF
jgi:hypothetical protein